MSAFGAASAQAADTPFPNMPGDSVSCLSMNGDERTPTSIVVAGSWDSTLSAYEVSYSAPASVNVVHRGSVKHEGPVICSDFNHQQQVAFSGSADGTVRMWNVTQGPSAVQQIGKHDQPVRLYAMDAKGKIIVLGTADQHLHVWADITQLQNKYEYKSPLNYQTKCISLFADRQGFALGSIEGRVAIEYFNECHKKPPIGSNQKASTDGSQSFVFKCHRDGNEIYAVNDIDFYPTNKFLTAGGDGVIVWWDKDKRNRLSIRDRFKKESPIATAKFSPNGQSMFYAASYDWSRGADFAPQCQTNVIMHHAVKESDIATK
eukprot:GSChrysophyteH1.ASY1.ANO1.3111.1 assembled CDS